MPDEPPVTSALGMPTTLKDSGCATRIGRRTSSPLGSGGLGPPLLFTLSV